MAKLKISMIAEEIPIDRFDCGNQSINSLVSKSYFPTILQHAYAYSFSYDHTILGYYMLVFKQIPLDKCPEDVAEYRSDLFDSCYSVHIEYIAVNKCFQNRGIGHNILRMVAKNVFSLCRHLPIRLITLDALKDKYSFYKNLGFTALNDSDMDNESSTIFMYQDCLLRKETVNNYIDQFV